MCVVWSMESRFGPLQARWCREGHAARFVAGLREVWALRLWDGSYVAFLPADLGAAEREHQFERLLIQHWCARYGLPEARTKMRALLRGDDVA